MRPPLQPIVWTRRASRRVRNLVYPPACLLCRRSLDTDQALFCEACQDAMSPPQPPLCQRCGLGVRGAYDALATCPSCRRRPPAFDRACAPFAYASRVREAIHAFKYHGHHRIGRWLADAMAATAERSLPLERLDAVVAVPMHPLKQRLKGTNPAEELARGLAETLRLPHHPSLLRRRRWTTTQTRLKPSQRFRNVRDAFAPGRATRADGAVLLVDDVLTSGATAHACALALRAAGARAVFVLTAARAPQPPVGR